MSKDIAIQAAEMLAAAGAKDIYVYQEILRAGTRDSRNGHRAHGRDPKTSVLNEHNQAHMRKLFLTEAPVWFLCLRDPSLTYMALTARAAISRFRP